MKRLIISAIVLFSVIVNAQYYSGETEFLYLNICVSPVSQALSNAGAAAFGRSGDLVNPAGLSFLDEKSSASLNYMYYVNSSHFGLFTFSRKTFQIYLKYFNSGSMEMRDSLNNDLGTFSSNTIILEGAKAFRLNDHISLGGALNVGLETVSDYNASEVSFSAGMIYKKLYKDFLHAGLLVSNAGASLSSGDANILSTKVMAGLSISKDEMPFAVYIDFGKSFDSKYSYSAGLELYLMKSKYSNAVESQVNAFTAYEDTAKSDTVEIDSTEIAQTDSTGDSILVSVDSIARTDADTLEADSLKAETDTDTTGYYSYADYLEDENNDSLKAESEKIEEAEEKPVQIFTPVEPKKTAKKPASLNNMSFVVRFGVSDIRDELQMGLGTDLLAGLTAGFGLTYKNTGINYSARNIGELGISQTIGLDFRF